MSGTAWDDFQKRRAILMFSLVGYLPVGLFVSLLSKAFSGSESIVIPLALGWMIAFAVAIDRFAHFPCPRCCGPILYSGWIYASRTQCVGNPAMTHRIGGYAVVDSRWQCRSLAERFFHREGTV